VLHNYQGVRINARHQRRRRKSAINKNKIIENIISVAATATETARLAPINATEE